MREADLEGVLSWTGYGVVTYVGGLPTLSAVPGECRSKPVAEEAADSLHRTTGLRVEVDRWIAGRIARAAVYVVEPVR